MKKKLFIVVIGLIHLYTSCSEDSYDIEDLPFSIKMFWEYHIPEYEIIDISIMQNVPEDSPEKYIVTFTDNLVVAFDEEGAWLRITGMHIPQKLLNFIDSEHMDIIKNTYSYSYIYQIEEKSFGTRVILDTGSPLVIYRHITSWNVGLDLSGSLNQLPARLRSFLNTCKEEIYQKEPIDFLNYIVYVGEPDIKEYYMAFQDGRKMSFDREGEWFSFSSYEKSLPSFVYHSLPEIVKNYLENELVDKEIYGIRKYEEYYNVELREPGNPHHTSLFTIDLENGRFVYPTPEVQDFLEIHFGNKYPNSLSVGLELEEGKVFYDFSISMDGYNIFMKTDKYGEWKKINTKGIPIPGSILMALPSPIQLKLASDYRDEPVYGVDRIGNTYLIILSKDILEFDKEGNLLKEEVEEYK